MGMIENLVPIYGCATLTITALGLMARQNRKSGWKRQRANNMAEALQDFYSDLGVVTEEMAPTTPAEVKALTEEEIIGFTAEMLKLRSALGASTAITEEAVISDGELVPR